jgi:hypothetical protein
MEGRCLELEQVDGEGELLRLKSLSPPSSVSSGMFLRFSRAIVWLKKRNDRGRRNVFSASGMTVLRANSLNRNARFRSSNVGKAVST